MSRTSVLSMGYAGLLKAEISEKQARSIKYQLTVPKLPPDCEQLSPKQRNF
jgi:hypothetical protein